MTKAQQALRTLVGEFLGTARPTGSKATRKLLDFKTTYVQPAAAGRFWAQMRSPDIVRFSNASVLQTMTEADPKILSADITLEHISELQKERAQILARISATESQRAAKQSGPKFEPQTPWGLDTQAEASVLAQEFKAKAKTRSERTVEQSNLRLKDLEISSNSNEPSQIKSAVSKPYSEVPTIV